jgi:hypothetical protein
MPYTIVASQLYPGEDWPSICDVSKCGEMPDDGRIGPPSHSSQDTLCMGYDFAKPYDRILVRKVVGKVDRFSEKFHAGNLMGKVSRGRMSRFKV